MAELAWPADLGHGTFTGRFGFMDADSHDPDREPDITSATGGTVTITPSIKSVRYTGAQGPMILAARPAKGVIDSEGYLCTATADGDAGDRGMVFPATDDTDLTPTDWTYEVSIILDGQVRIGTFNVKLPEGATVDLSLAVPVPSSGGTAVVVDPTTAERAEAAATRAETAAAEAEDYAPTFVWDGTALSIDGKPGVDLKGDPGTTAWADLTGTPDTFPSTVADVTGLEDRLGSVEYYSGSRNIAGMFPVEVAVLSATLQRVGRTVTLAWGARFPDPPSATTVNLFTLPSGFRPSTPILGLWEPALAARSSGRVFINSPSGLVVSYQSTAQSAWCFFSATYITPDPLPAVLPGTPA